MGNPTTASKSPYSIGQIKIEPTLKNDFKMTGEYKKREYEQESQAPKILPHPLNALPNFLGDAYINLTNADKQISTTLESEIHKNQIDFNKLQKIKDTIKKINKSIVELGSALESLKI